MGLSMQHKKVLTREISKRYQKAEKKEKTKILDELVKTTGYNRKYILHVLANWETTTTVTLDRKTVKLKASPNKRKKGGGRKPIYNDEFVTVLRNIWVFFWYRCGKMSPSSRNEPYLQPVEMLPCVQ